VAGFGVQTISPAPFEKRRAAIRAITFVDATSGSEFAVSVRTTWSEMLADAVSLK